ncbi:hypothetical protein NHQ30_003766 [Ciborinia camelliae]|nr:hypothetical protein NHQ30_003766 [Ciborinia camelliae]
MQSALFRLLVGNGRPRLEAPSPHQFSLFDSKNPIPVHKAAEEMAAKKSSIDEDVSLIKIKQTTKLCPGCSWPIEKNNGCDHMMCDCFSQLSDLSPSLRSLDVGI